jgi:hypothetical protein
MENKTTTPVESANTESTKQAPVPSAATIDDPVVARKLQVFDRLDSVYRQDPEVKEIIDSVLSGRPLTKNQDKVLKAATEAVEDGPEDDYKKLLKRIELQDAELKKIKNAQQYRDIDSHLTQNGYQYLDRFAELAEAAGFLPNTAGYNTLYELAEKKGREYARAIGLVDDLGQPNPRLQYNPKLIERSFADALQALKSLGYDAVEDRRKHFKKREEEKIERENLKYKEILKPERLRTPEGRAAALEEIVRSKGLI